MYVRISSITRGWYSQTSMFLYAGMVRVNVRLYKIVQYFVILPQYPFKVDIGHGYSFLQRNMPESVSLLYRRGTAAVPPQPIRCEQICRLATLYGHVTSRMRSILFFIFGFSLLSLKVDIFDCINCIS